MKQKVLVIGFMILLIIIFNNCKRESGFSVSKSHYLGQKPPGMTPEIFAPGIVNTDAQNHSCVAISPDGKEMYWSLFSIISGVRQERIWFSEMKNGTWMQPRVAPFSGEYREGGPRFSYDGTRLYFTSLRPTSSDDKSTDANIWVIERMDNGWGQPKSLDFPVNTEFQEWFPTIAKNGNLYYMFRKSSQELWDIYLSEYIDGQYTDPKKLADSINSPYVDGFCFIDPEEQFLIFYSERPGGCCEHGELYISFKRDDGSWAEARNMGPWINPTFARFPGVSPDGKYFFFSNMQDGKEAIYWIDATIINNLKPEHLLEFRRSSWIEFIESD